MFCWLSGWQVVWLTECWLSCYLVGLVGWLVGWLVDAPTGVCMRLHVMRVCLQRHPDATQGDLGQKPVKVLSETKACNVVADLRKHSSQEIKSLTSQV